MKKIVISPFCFSLTASSGKILVNSFGQYYGSDFTVKSEYVSKV